MTSLQHTYEVRPRKDHRGVDLISDALPFGRLWYGEPNAISNAKFFSSIFSVQPHTVAIVSHDDFLTRKRRIASRLDKLLNGAPVITGRERSNLYGFSLTPELPMTS